MICLFIYPENTSKVIYLSTIDGITNSKCIKLGIEVKKVTSIEEDKLLSSLYLIPPFF